MREWVKPWKTNLCLILQNITSWSCTFLFAIKYKLVLLQQNLLIYLVAYKKEIKMNFTCWFLWQQISKVCWSVMLFATIFTLSPIYTEQKKYFWLYVNVCSWQRQKFSRQWMCLINLCNIHLIIKVNTIYNLFQP